MMDFGVFGSEKGFWILVWIIDGNTRRIARCNTPDDCVKHGRMDIEQRATSKSRTRLSIPHGTNNTACKG